MIIQIKYYIEADLPSAQHNASSPLLSLPLEIKNLIYELIFGGNIIHINQNPNKGGAKFKSTICRAAISEEEAQKNFDDETNHEWFVPANEDRHSCCRYRKGTTSGDENQRPQLPRLDALRCCRQMYNEAHHVPYSANTFSCADPRTLQNFIHSLARGDYDNHLAVRSLIIEVVYSCASSCETSNHSNWRKTLSTCAKHLKNLNRVNISLEWKCWSLGDVMREVEAKGINWRVPWISGILVLKKLPLKSATLVISDAKVYEAFHRFLSPSENPIRRTLQEKQEWARYVKEIILK